MSESKPMPGSKEAIEAGCNCPVMDNRHGLGIPMVNPETKEVQFAYWMTADCIIHGVNQNPEVMIEQQGN
jgi:hypothetical protein